MDVLWVVRPNPSKKIPMQSKFGNNLRLCDVPAVNEQKTDELGDENGRYAKGHLAFHRHA
jgi:hypothetical protein